MSSTQSSTAGETAVTKDAQEIGEFANDVVPAAPVVSYAQAVRKNNTTSTVSCFKATWDSSKSDMKHLQLLKQLYRREKRSTEEEALINDYRLTHEMLAEYPEHMLKLLYPHEASELILAAANRHYQKVEKEAGGVLYMHETVDGSFNKFSRNKTGEQFYTACAEYLHRTHRTLFPTSPYNIRPEIQAFTRDHPVGRKATISIQFPNPAPACGELLEALQRMGGCYELGKLGGAVPRRISDNKTNSHFGTAITIPDVNCDGETIGLLMAAKMIDLPDNYPTVVRQVTGGMRARVTVAGDTIPAELLS